MIEEFPDRCKGKSDKQIRDIITGAVSKKVRVCENGPFVAYSRDDLMEVLKEKAEKLVHFAYSLKDVEEGKEIQSKSKTDMVAFMKKEFPDRCKGKNDKQIRDIITRKISKKVRVCENGPFVAYSSDDLMEVLKEKTGKKAKKKGTDKAKAKAKTEGIAHYSSQDKRSKFQGTFSGGMKEGYGLEKFHSKHKTEEVMARFHQESKMDIGRGDFFEGKASVEFHYLFRYLIGLQHEDNKAILAMSVEDIYKNYG